MAQNLNYLLPPLLLIAGDGAEGLGMLRPDPLNPPLLLLLMLLLLKPPLSLRSGKVLVGLGSLVGLSILTGG
jgi:hypothetical protein